MIFSGAGSCADYRQGIRRRWYRYRSARRDALCVRGDQERRSRSSTTTSPELFAGKAEQSLSFLPYLQISVLAAFRAMNALPFDRNAERLSSNLFRSICWTTVAAGFASRSFPKAANVSVSSYEIDPYRLVPPGLVQKSFVDLGTARTGNSFGAEQDDDQKCSFAAEIWLLQEFVSMMPARMIVGRKLLAFMRFSDAGSCQ